MPESPQNLDSLRQEVAKVAKKALGPHLDTPIYDQLTREYDEKYNTTSYFDSALHDKLNRWSRRSHKHG
jgi:hypothetical protein